jgi:hypothetical protein
VLRYFLNNHVYACEADGHAVFLDLKRDKYIAVPPPAGLEVRRYVHGWQNVVERTGTVAQDHSSVENTPTEGSSMQDILKSLAQEGLLTASESTGWVSPETIAVPEPGLTFVADPSVPQHVSCAHRRNFTIAWATTGLRLRFAPMPHLLMRVRRRAELYGRRNTAIDVCNLRDLTLIHNALQPKFYAAKDACLRNSLTLIEFMSLYGIYPWCVIGVRMNPFCAHAWAQFASTVLTEPAYQVTGFKPIFVA